MRLRRHLGDTSSGKDVDFAELEMTDMDLSSALQAITDIADGTSKGQEDGDEDGAGSSKSAIARLAEALTAVGTVKMLLGDQPAAVDALERARAEYDNRGDDEGSQKAEALLTDVRRIMDKVDSTSVTPSGAAP
mmetsp:Transcript_80088/g.214390  ORF Transcript_80088/g.214390 Transcript_80088/m.214390 type:complete len:134 (+) Transcript_80088:138-539(+)